MEVEVTDNRGVVIKYGYAPEHYAGVDEFYAGLVAEKKIQSYWISLTQ
jgi:hypothetical protein